MFVVVFLIKLVNIDKKSSVFVYSLINCMFHSGNNCDRPKLLKIFCI